MKKMYSGSITVFCGLVLPFVILFLLCLFYYGRHQTIESSIRRDSDAAGFSTLAEYDRTWVQEYGLYVVPKKQIEEDFRFYMEENRNHSWGNYAIEDLTITKTNSLEDKAELQEQILMFMKERGLLEMIEEVGNAVLQIKDLDQQVENEVNWKESDHLLRVQQLYGELVTLFEGVRSDGNKNLYSINYLLDEKPALSEVLEILKLEKLNSEQVGVLEQTYDELDHVAYLCTEAQKVGAELEIAIDELETRDQLPVTSTQLREYRKVLKVNRELCEEASKTIQNWISLLVEDAQLEDVRSDTIQIVEQLEEFDRSIQLPYEYRKADKSWDFSSILSSLKGYPLTVEDIAANEELDLGEEEQETEMAESPEVDLEDITIGESFGDQFLVTEYALGMFQNFQEAVSSANGSTNGRKALNLRGDEKKNRFFTNEVEYLLIGKPNEYKNVNGAKNYIMTLRSLMNMVHLLTDSEKRAEIELMAGAIGGILLPGIGNGIFFGIILAIWSWGEAIADYQVLVKGGEIPLLKTRESWKTDLASILSVDVPESHESSQEGMDYKQYMRLMLYMVDQEKLLSRVQKLLYLNHQKKSLTEAVTGFVMEGTASYGITEFTFNGEYGYGSYDQ